MNNTVTQSRRTREVLIPFRGFHEDEKEATTIDHQTSMLFSNAAGDAGAHKDLEERFWNEVEIDWDNVKREYGALYVDVLGDCLAASMQRKSMDSMAFLDLEFVGMSDRHNDRLYATVAVSDLKRLREGVSDASLLAQAQHNGMLKSFEEGWIGEKETAPDRWGDLDTWNQYQLGCLVQAYINRNDLTEEFEDAFSLALIDEGWRVHDWIQESVSDKSRAAYEDICTEAYERVEAEGKAEMNATL